MDILFITVELQEGFMEKRTNNYLVIIIVLLLVVAIIAGAGLCYLSWSDEYVDTDSSFDTTQSAGISGAGDSASAETPEQSGTDGSASAETPTQSDTDGSASTETPTQSGVEDSISAGADARPGTENSTASESGEQSDQEPGTATEPGGQPEQSVEIATLQANSVTMDQIMVSVEGEYTYQKDGRVVSHKGIDVSKYQQKIDWKKVAADGVEYAFIRVGCRGYGGGSMIKDERFHENVKAALAENIQVGTYFFSQAITMEEVLEEADFVIKELEGYEITYPVVIDIERVDGEKARQDALDKETRTKLCLAFLERIKEAGYTPMVYGELETFSELLDIEQLVGYDFWICETGGTMTFPYEFAVWQYSHTGKVDGIKGETSLSISLKEW